MLGLKVSNTLIQIILKIKQICTSVKAKITQTLHDFKPEFRI